MNLSEVDRKDIFEVMIMCRRSAIGSVLAY